MRKLISFLAIVAMVSFIGCNSTSTKQSAEQSAWEEAFAQGEPIVLAPNDTIEFGVPQPEPIVVDFWAEWCPPCREFSPIFHKVAKQYKGAVRFISINVDSCPGIAKEYGVGSIPTVLIVSKEGTINRNVGFMTENQLVESIEAVMPEKK
ncbi:MAG: thioredoxin fold domain-containing protein [Bacteroides sp.]|nr:thioredoxin fold domain-containing protein [Bacteroides sp.]